MVLDISVQNRMLGKTPITYDLSRSVTSNLIEKLDFRGAHREGLGFEFPGSNVQSRQSEELAFPIDGKDEVIAVRIKIFDIGYGAGRDDTDHLTTDYPFRLRRI